MNIRREFLLLICCALGALPACGQADATQSDEIQLVRMQRVRRNEDLCVLVSSTGAYRLERVYPNKSEVFLGTVAAAKVDVLSTWLNGAELRRLTQQQIPAPLASDSRDQFLLAVDRPEGLQRLSFVTPDSRKPFAASLDPVMAWFNTLLKDRPGAKKVEEAPNHCLPAPEQVAPAAPARAITAAAAKAPAASLPFVMRIAVQHIYNRQVSRTCATIYPDGRYLMEKSEQEIGYKVRAKVFKDAVTAAELSELRQLLDTPEMMSMKHMKLPEGQTIREGEVTMMDIARPDGIQNLAFTAVFGIYTDPSKHTTQTLPRGSRFETDEDVKLLLPIRKWVKDAVESRKVPEVKNPVPTDCLPETR